MSFKLHAILSSMKKSWAILLHPTRTWTILLSTTCPLLSVGHSCPSLCNPMDCSMPRPLCPSPSPEVCPSSCPLHQWCYPAIISSEDHMLILSLVPSIFFFISLLTLLSIYLSSWLRLSVLPLLNRLLSPWFFALLLLSLIYFLIIRNIKDLWECFNCFTRWQNHNALFQSLP